MRWIKRIILLVVLVVILAGAIVYVNLNRMVRRAVEVAATSSLNLGTTLEGASLSLMGGSLSLKQLEIASPQGYPAPRLLTLQGAAVKVEYGQLRKTPIHVASVVLDKPRLVIEQQGGKFNIRAVIDQLPPSGSEPMELVIDHLEMRDAVVVMRPGLPGLDRDVIVQVPLLEMKNVGSGKGAENGAAVKEVVLEIVSALAARARESGNVPEQLKAALSANVDSLKQKLAAEMQKAVGGALEKALQGAGKDLEKGLGGMLGGERKPPTTRPR